MIEKLTGEQVARRDAVDAEILTLIEDLVPERFQERAGDLLVDYDEDLLAGVRAAIATYAQAILGIPDGSPDAEAFDRDFYPSSALEEAA